MSGAAGGTRIPRSAVEQTVKDYTEKILSKIEGFKDAKLSGSFNRPDKDDFGDIDIVVTIETGDDKKITKKKIMDLFTTLPDNELPPLRNPKYKGKKAINHGEMVSNLYPISGMPGEFVQVDNIIALSSEEGSFKKTVLDYPAELQGIILGLVKTPLLEEKPEVVFARMGIKDIPEPGPTQEYEFHIDTAGLTLRLVTYGDNYKILDSNTVWQSRDFADVEKLLKDFNLDGSFRELIEQVKNLKNPRSKNRVKGFFKRSIKVGAAERGTPKGDVKQQALDTVDTLQESKALLTRAKLATKYLDEDEKSRIAVFPGAFKPPHKDHIARINAASKKVGENGKVLVLVSPLPRTKEGQESISAEQTIAVFNLYKDKGIIPNNVAYRIADDNSPITAAYKEFESDKTQPYIAVFGKDDKARFSNIEDKLPNVVVDSFEEAGVGNASATDLRTAIANRDKETIATFIPAEVTAEEYLDTLGVKEPIAEDASTATNLWEPHAAMLAKIEKKPDLLRGLWKSLSKPSRKALVLYFREKNTQVENVIPAADEKAAPYGSGYTPVEEGLWANINAKKKRGEKPSHGNSNAFKAAKKAGDALEKTKGLEEGSGEKKLRVFDFDDTLVHVDATIYITHKDGTKSGLTPAEYAVYVPQEGDLFDFSEFSSVIKKAKPLESNIADLIKSYNDPTEKTTILTARLLGYPVKKYLKDEFNIEPYVIGLGSSDPEDKSRWIESQIKKGYNNIEFRDDSQKNVDAVASLKDKYPEVELTSTLVAEGVESISPKLTINENASYSKNIDIKYKIAELAQHMIDKGMNVQPLPSVEFINGNSKNAEEFLGKTAYYDPAVNKIVLYTEGRHPKDIVRSFAHEMIHHIQNLEGRLDNITTANTLEDSNLNDIEAEANLKGTMTFRNWTDSLNESNTIPELQKEKVNISFELFDGTKISEDITLAMSPNSQGLFELGDNIEKYSGLTLKDAQEFNETPDDAYIYGLVNTMNDGQDIFFWTNGTRLVGNAKRIGTQTAIIEQLAHEGLHLTRAILAKSVMGDGFPTEEWPSIGEQDNDRIEEEQLTTALSHVLEKISAPFIEMASKYIPELNPTPVQPNTADSLDELTKPPIKKDPFGLNAYAVELARELEEAIVGDKVECDNCDWSWKLDAGGKSPYLCHKCNHDNTPKLNEGAYDTMTAQVSSDIFKAWKDQFSKDNTVEQATFIKSYDLLSKTGRSIVFDLQADLNFIETEESIYAPNGNADAGDSEIYDDEGDIEDAGIDGSIHLYFQVDPRTLPKLWSTISMDLKDTVRHEIEHLTQAGYNVIPSKELPDDKRLRYYINDLGILPASNYYLLDKEIPAMLQGLHYKAKKMKRPFKEVAEAYLDIFVNNGTIDAEAKVDVLNRWKPEAKKLNLPSL